MIRAVVAVLAPAVWILTPIFRPAAKRRRCAGGQPSVKTLETPGSHSACSSAPRGCSRATNTPDREIDSADVKRNRAIGHSHSGGRSIGRRSSVAYQALYESGLFSKIDFDTLSAAAEQVELVQFPAGDTIADQSSRCDHVYVIISGKVKVSHRRREGSEMMLSILGPKEIFGALMLFDPEAHEITATALTEVVAVSIDRDQFLVWIAQCPGFSDQLLRLFARWVKASTTSLVDFSVADVQSRVANQLLFLRKRFGRLEGEVVRVVHDLTLEEFALLVRVAPDRVCETLRVFQNRGWIRLEDNSVVVVDAHALSSLSHTNMPEVSCA